MILKLYLELKKEHRENVCNEIAQVTDLDSKTVERFIIYNRVPEYLKEVVKKFLQIEMITQSISLIDDYTMLFEMNRKYRELIESN